MALGDDALAIAARVRSGETSARAEVEGALARIDLHDRILHAFVAVDAEAALAAADALDALPPSERGPLAGVPLAVKDTEDAVGYTTTYGSLVHVGDPPASVDSTVVARLKAAGCVVVGKVNTPEHAFFASTDNRVFPATVNPWSAEHGVGGSSGGSAAAVAGGMVPLATASDGGGSIRIPAAVTGLPGFKPSIGRVPHGDVGAAPDWPELSTRGLLAGTVASTLAAYDAIVGPDHRDLRSLPAEAPWASITASLPGSVAWSPGLGYARVDGEVLAICRAAAVRLTTAFGAVLDAVEDVLPSDPVAAWLTSTATHTHRLVDPERLDLLDQRLAAVLRGFGSGSGVDLARTSDAFHAVRAGFVRAFDGRGLLLTPTIAGQVPLLARNGTIDGSEDLGWVGLTYPANMANLPAASVPVGISTSGLPVGLQVIGPPLGDRAVLAAMLAAEATFGSFRPAR